jgi:hypothetical protein
MSNELPDNVLNLLHRGVPTYTAAEYLLLIRKVERFETIDELRTLRQPAAELSEVQSYLSLFQTIGLVQHRENHFQYAPESPELREAVEALAAAYNERPVTLIRTLYALTGSKIQSFADSFKIKET